MQSFQPILVIITRVDSNGDFCFFSDGYFMFDRPPAASRRGKYASLSSPVKTLVCEIANAQIVTNSLRDLLPPATPQLPLRQGNIFTSVYRSVGNITCIMK